MKVLQYNAIKHSTLVRKSLVARGLSPDCVETVPKFGLIALTSDNEFIACGFIREVEGNIAMLDSYLSNPEIPFNQRDRALDIITMKLIKIALKNRVIKLIAFSEFKAIINRAIKHGFKKINYEAVIFS